MMSISALEKHKAIIKQRSRDAYTTHIKFWRLQILASYTIALIAIIAAVLSVGIAYKTASSIVVQNQVRTVDRYGQTLGFTGVVYRIPSGIQTHAFLSDFIYDVFSVVDSPLAMQRNYLQAQSYVDVHSPVPGYLKDFWQTYSPLQSNGSWNRRNEQERSVQVTSILDRGTYSAGGEEYEIEWNIRPDIGGGHLGDPKPYKGDIVLTNGANPTDANPWGVLISHFSWNDLR